MSKKQKVDNKNGWLIGLSLVFVLFLMITVFVIYLNKGAEEKKSVFSLGGEEIVENNKNAIEMAMNSNEVRTPRRIDTNDHYFGELGAPVSMIVYSDFDCFFCHEYYEVIKKVKEVYGDQVVVAFRHFIDRNHPNALSAAIASECAAEQGKFWDMYELLFLDNKMNRLSIEQYKRDANELKLNQKQFSDCVDSEKYREKVIADWEAGKKAGVYGVPGGFLNDIVITGATPFEDYVSSDGRENKGLRNIIDGELEKKEK